MKYFVFCLTIFLWLHCVHADAKPRKNDRNTPPQTEQQLIDSILYCMQYHDTVTYASVFPTFDTLWKMVLMDTLKTDSAEMVNLIAHPERLQQFDPSYNHIITSDFYKALIKGKDSGIHWKYIALRSFKLQKIILTRDLIGFEKIAPIRFQGYVFIRDMLARKNYVFSVNELQYIQGYWYGGQVINIFPGSTIDDYLKAEAAEARKRKKMLEFGITDNTASKDDSAGKIATQPSLNDDDDEAYNEAKEVVDRKYYIGKFDNEIPVKLYVRYIKSACPQDACEWQAIYQIGNQNQFVKLDVSKAPNGTWSFVEDPPIGYMDLVLKNKVYTGSWTTTDDNQTGYDVKLTETEVTSEQLHKLDEIIEKGLWAKPKGKGSRKPANPDDDDDDN